MNITAWKMDFLEHKALQCTPPCSMYSVLLEHGRMEDPFYGTNEREAMALSEHDCKFYSEFTADAGMLEKEHLELEFYGLDTLCDIFLNGSFLAHTENMHRKYVFAVKDRLRCGSNLLELKFRSPVQHARQMENRHHLENNRENMPGASHLRKALYMTGWDWGPRLPDMGIFRQVRLRAYDGDVLEHTVIRQRHTAGQVELTFDISTRNHSGCDVFVEIDGQRVQIPDGHTPVIIRDPRLWWVRGYGPQNLYPVVITLEKDGQVLDREEKRIGLRTLTVSTQKLPDGNEFCFVNNGVKIFAMGANFIPQDSFYARITKQTTKQRIEDCLFANYNCIRVWGGGYYPEDDFYDLCDEHGLLVWQDFMVACASIYLSRTNEESMAEEAAYNFSRIAHHACLGILCGNNEMELAVTEWEGFNTELCKLDYLRLYEHILPDICEKYAPDVFYWPSSPSSGGGFDAPHDKNRGDVHEWAVWHGCSPFAEYRKHHYRFCSEFGFESFPSIKTVDSFCPKDQQSIFSPVMENHQKNDAGNRKILMYMEDRYGRPEEFADFLYLSQIQQAEAVKTGVEHFRRDRGYCMGAIYWQMNDCWPVVSWSGVDYYGRYKALHYAARKFYAPVAHSIHPENGGFTVNVVNETREDKTVTVRWGLCRNDNTVLRQGRVRETVAALSAKDVLTLPVENPSAGDTYFYADLYDGNGEFIMRQTELFTEPKAFAWLDPEISVTARVADGGTELEFTAKNFARDILVDFQSRDVVLSDNVFSLVDGRPYRILAKTDGDTQTLLEDLTVRCVNKIYKNGDKKNEV